MSGKQGHKPKPPPPKVDGRLATLAEKAAKPMKRK